MCESFEKWIPEEESKRMREKIDILTREDVTSVVLYQKIVMDLAC